MNNLQKYLDEIGITLEDASMVKNKNFSNLMNGIKTYEPSVVDLREFTTKEGRLVKYFWYKTDDPFRTNKTVAKPSSRSAFYNNREPFEIEPWNQILIDEANVYGSSVDDDIERFYNKEDVPEDTLYETIMSIHNMKINRLVWVGRSVMVCHPKGYAYGEVDELLYSPETDTYFVGDTKTSSSVVKGSYTYQLATYIEILRMLNPDKKFAPLGLINWVKVKKEKWDFDRNFDTKYWTGIMTPEVMSQLDKETIKDHPVYRSKWKGKNPIQPEITEMLIGIDVDKLQMTNLVRADWWLIYEILPKYGYFAYAGTLPQAIAENPTIAEANRRVQARFDSIKSKIENSKEHVIIINSKEQHESRTLTWEQ